MKKNQKILVTGGAGYIGSHVLLLLEKKGYEIVVIDNLSTSKKENVLYGRLIINDMGDIKFLEKLMCNEKFDSIVHFAGSIIVPESIKDPIKYYKNNTSNSFELIRLAIKYNVKNFIFSSTAAVYGMPNKGLCDEDTLTHPINPYGRSKLITEWFLEDISRKSDFNYISLRYFNVAGANVDGRIGQSSPFSTHLIKVACEAALGKREKLTVYGNDYLTTDGTCIRDYIHIDDLGDAHIRALEYLWDNGHSCVLNCGYGKGFSVNEVVTQVQKISRSSFKVEIGKRRDGDPAMLIAKSNKIKQTLNWKPRYNDLEFICKTALEWERKLK